MKDKLYLVLGIVVVVGSFYLFLQKPAPQQYQTHEWRTDEMIFPGSALKIGERLIPIEIADSPEERTLGLSGREKLEEGTGLLFIFETSGNYGFWMKDMNFPIDIVWIDENWRVVSVAREVKPETYPTVLYPNGSSKYVLELNSGEALRLGIDTGLEVSLVR